MKVLDVNTLQTGIDVTINDITSFCEHISTVQRAVRDFSALDDALRGKGGEAIRAFYEECHQPFLIFLHQSLIDYQFQLKDIKSAIQTFEPDEQGFIDEAFLMNDVQQGFTKVERKTIELTDEANSILASVQDIVTVNKITESDVMDGVRRGKLRAQEIVEQLHLLDDYGATLLEQTRDALQTMRTYLSDIESKFQSGDLSVTNFNSDALQGMASYNSIMDSIYNKDTADVELNADTIEGMSLDDIEKAKNATVEGLSDEGKTVLDYAYNQLKNGEITRSKYLEIVNGMVKWDNNPNEEMTEEDISFLDYLMENSQWIGGEVGLPVIGELIRRYGERERARGTALLTRMITVRGQNFSSFGQSLGKWGGTALSGVGAAFGFHDDVTNHDKTYGEAFAHNGAVLGAGFIPAIAVAAVGVTPVGWAAAGVAAAGALAAAGFNYLYQTNWLGIQDGLDAIGRGLDFMAKGVWNFARNPGEAIQNGVNTANELIDNASVYVQNTADSTNVAIQSGVDTTKQAVEGLGYIAQQDTGLLEGFAIEIGANLAGEAIEYAGNQLQKGVATTNEITQAGLGLMQTGIESAGDVVLTMSGFEALNDVRADMAVRGVSKSTNKGVSPPSRTPKGKADDLK
ncbi:LXG domain-containing protein [Bacillus sp. A116_S68]|nr:LXG domain-containing protein [Bacillus sp. A116_S68]